MNLLQKFQAREKALIESKSVKLMAVEFNDNKIALTSSGMIVPENEIQKFENGFIWVSGVFAAKFDKLEAYRLNQLMTQ
jgi:hypothetical protein